MKPQDPLAMTRLTIKLSMEREPGAVRPPDPLVRSLEAADPKHAALLMAALSRRQS